MVKYPVTKPYFDKTEKELIYDSIDSGWVAQGPKVAEFEKRVAEHEGIAEGIATTSCTTALHLALITQGLRDGMDAIAPAFTFVATVNAIVQTGATPVLVDIRKDTFNIDVTKIEKLIENRYIKQNEKLINKESGNTLWGIVPVHQFGLCCDINRINEIASDYSLQIIEDAACALGSSVDGVHQGNFGNTSCVSFHPRKSITTGEGGMILTNDKVLAKRLRELRTHGSTISADARDKNKGFLLPEFNEAGFNYRMTDMQGAMGLAQIKKLDNIIDSKRESVCIYNELISERIPELIIPVEASGYYHTYQSYVCRLDVDKMRFNSIEDAGEFRNELLDKLEQQGIATRQGTHAVHMLNYYKNRFGYLPDDYKNAYECDRASIALPLYVGITKADQEYIVDKIRVMLDEINNN